MFWLIAHGSGSLISGIKNYNMKYKVLGGRWGEGYKAGDIINIDLEAAQVRLQLGELEEVNETEKPVQKEQVAEEKKEENTSETIQETENENKPKRGRPPKVV